MTEFDSRKVESVVEVLLFDLGGVLVDFAGFRELKSFVPQPIEDVEIRRRWLASPSVRAFELGVSNDEDFANDFVVEWSLELDSAEFLEEFRSWPRALKPGAEELLDRLRSDHRLACLSNTNRVHWEVVEPWIGRLFDDYFLSFRLGAVKPDVTPFTMVLEALGVPADAVLFFDDSIQNVVAAHSLGIQAATVSSLEEIDRYLRGELIDSRGPTV